MDKEISAFAFNTGRAIGRIINEETNNLKDRNQLLEAKILTFRQELENHSNTETNEGEEAIYWLQRFEKHFNIQVTRQGKI